MTEHDADRIRGVAAEPHTLGHTAYSLRSTPEEPGMRCGDTLAELLSATRLIRRPDDGGSANLEQRLR